MSIVKTICAHLEEKCFQITDMQEVFVVMPAWCAPKREEKL